MGGTFTVKEVSIKAQEQNIGFPCVGAGWGGAD
jgi:hypothetical protein